MMNMIARCMRINANCIDFVYNILSLMSMSKCHNSSQNIYQTLTLTYANLTSAPHLAILAVGKAATTPMNYSYSWSPQTPTLLASETPYYNSK